MKKWLYLFSVAVILGLLSISYYITGVRAEAEFGNFLKSANRLPNVVVTADNYHRGWLKSSVHIKVVLHRSEQLYIQSGETKTIPARDVTFSFNTHIYHGPIILAPNRVAFGLGYARSDVSLPKEMLLPFNEIFTEQSAPPHFVFAFLLKYRHQLLINFDVPPFNLFSKNGVMQLNWKGFKSHWKLKAHSLIVGDMAFNGAFLKQGDTESKVDGAHLKYHLQMEDNLFVGKVTGNLQTLQWAPDKVPSLRVDGLQMASDSHIKDNLISSSLKADVNGLAFRGVEYGPGVLDMEVNDLDAEALDHIQQQLQITQNNHLTNAQKQVLFLTLLPEIPKLIEKGAELKIKQLQLSIPQGLILAVAKIKFSPGKADSLQWINRIDAFARAEVPVVWLQDVFADLLKFKIEQRQLSMQQKFTQEQALNENTQNNDTLVLPIKSLSPQEMEVMANQQASEQLTGLVQNGVLIKKDNLYTIKITFKNGVLLVNEKPFSGNVIQ